MGDAASEALEAGKARFTASLKRLASLSHNDPDEILEVFKRNVEAEMPCDCGFWDIDAVPEQDVRDALHLWCPDAAKHPIAVGVVIKDIKHIHHVRQRASSVRQAAAPASAAPAVATPVVNPHVPTGAFDASTTVASFEKHDTNEEYTLTLFWDSTPRARETPFWVAERTEAGSGVAVHAPGAGKPPVSTRLYRGLTLPQTFIGAEMRELCALLAKETVYEASETIEGEAGRDLTTYFWCPKGTLRVHLVDYDTLTLPK